EAPAGVHWMSAGKTGFWSEIDWYEAPDTELEFDLWPDNDPDFTDMAKAGGQALDKNKGIVNVYFTPVLDTVILPAGANLTVTASRGPKVHYGDDITAAPGT